MNGWNRLWSLVTVVWVFPFAYIFLLAALDGGSAFSKLPGWYAGAALLCIVPPVFLYALGLGVAWVRRGFKNG